MPKRGKRDAPDESTHEVSLRDAGVYDRIYALIQQIPPGCVATYGQIAALEGRATARQVGYALAALPDGMAVPWQRVVNRAGQVSERTGGGDSGQRRLLSEEGVLFNARGRLRFSQCGWDGPDYDWLMDNGFEPAEAPDDR